jgi:hypothetical protein
MTNKTIAKFTNAGVLSGTDYVPISQGPLTRKTTIADLLALSPATGTVTDVSVLSANGISGLVATSTTTPVIMLSLGDITPTSIVTTNDISSGGNIVATGTVTGSNISGTSSGSNTGDQNLFSTISVSGQSDVVADTLADTLTLVAGANVTITTNAGTDSITIAAASGGVTDGDKGDIIVSGSGATWTIDTTGVAAGSYTNTNLTVNAKGQITAASSGSAGSVPDGDKGDITVTASGATWTIDPQAVSYSKIQNVSATDKVLGRSTAGAGTIEEITFTGAARTFSAAVDAAAERTVLGLGTLATQSGTFSGTSSGTNTGDQNLFGTISVSGQSDVVADTTSDTLTLVAGSNVTITTNAGTDSITIAASAGGLTNWTEAVNTSAPNATIPAVSFTPNNAAASVDAVLQVKGASGALLAQVPDNGTGGGNKRGAQAVDWQMSRATNNQVASGSNATIGGGRRNTVAGSDAVVAGGFANSASSTSDTVAGGSTNTASGGTSTVAGGTTNTASGQHGAIGGGSSNTASGVGSAVPGGTNNTSDGSRSIVSGYLGNARGIEGPSVHSSGNPFSSSSGSAQAMKLVVAGQTSNATPQVITVTGSSSGNGTNQLVLPNSSAYLVSGMMVSRQDATGDTKSWTFSAHIRRGANAAATALVAAVTPTVVAADAGASSWTFTVTADTTNGALLVTVTGEAAKTLRWVCSMDSVQVVG